MPNRDGTGPRGGGQGRGMGRNFNQGGHGRNSGRAYGPGGNCVCPKCRTTIPHQRGTKCTEIKCPKCGNLMVREEMLK